jgi:hypothetical protein
MVNRAQLLRDARVAFRTGNITEMDRLVSETVAALHASSNDVERAEISHSLASFYRDIGILEASEVYARAAVEAERRLDRPALLGNHLMFLSMLLRDIDKVDEAIACAKEALPVFIAVYGQDHGETRHVARLLAEMTKQAASGLTSKRERN